MIEVPPTVFGDGLHPTTSACLELLADLTWTGWSSIESINVRGGTNPQLPYHFKDTWRVGLGVGYQMSDQWKLRAGVAFDEAPVRSASDRTMTLPDRFIDHASPERMYEMAGLDAAHIEAKVLHVLGVAVLGRRA